MITNNRLHAIFIGAVIILALVALGSALGLIDDLGLKVQKSDPTLAKVVSVADGDTITVNQLGKKEKVRLLGIDTPEKNHPEKAVQCFADEATDFLKDLVDGKQVRLEADPTNTNRDQYDRLLRYVYLEDDTFVNEAILEAGYGFAYTSFPLTKKSALISAERSAKNNSSGLWSSCEVFDDNGRSQTNPD